MRRQTFFVGRARSPSRVSQGAPRVCASSPPRACGFTRVRGLASTHSPSPSSPPPQFPIMTLEEEGRLVQAVMDDSEREYKHREGKECEGLQEMLQLSATEDVYVLELDAVKMEVKEEATEERAEASWSPAPAPPSL
ncbi:hypothetical protein D1007_00949 [Hordeum vulgare]|nr:hypothetical protein D1007_00949 [Hordeum vulgare]